MYQVSRYSNLYEKYIHASNMDNIFCAYGLMYESQRAIHHLKDHLIKYDNVAFTLYFSGFKTSLHFSFELFYIYFLYHILNTTTTTWYTKYIRIDSYIFFYTLKSSNIFKFHYGIGRWNGIL